MPVKQQSLPGVGPKRIEEIEDAAEQLRDLRSKRQTLATEEETAQQTLRDALKKHGFRKGKVYQFEHEDGADTIKLDVVLEQKEERAYVRKHKDPKADEDDEGEEGENDERAD